MAIWMNIFIEANEGMGSELAESYAKRCPAIREEPGCIQFEFYQSVDRPDFFILHEEWEDEAALDTHRLLAQKQRGWNLQGHRNGCRRRLWNLRQGGVGNGRGLWRLQ